MNYTYQNLYSIWPHSKYGLITKVSPQRTMLSERGILSEINLPNSIIASNVVDVADDEILFRCGFVLSADLKPVQHCLNTVINIGLLRDTSGKLLHNEWLSKSIRTKTSIIFPGPYHVVSKGHINIRCIGHYISCGLYLLTDGSLYYMIETSDTPYPVEGTGHVKLLDARFDALVLI